jgi:3-hydroxybutyrate dehydrogenase
VYGLVGSPSRAALVASKHGLIGITKTTALENSQNGITSNAICPGFVLTELNESKIKEIAREYGLNE